MTCILCGVMDGKGGWEVAFGGCMLEERGELLNHVCSQNLY